ncbi:hypothetical protein GCM10010384_65470 [Streptomyces djakartensis]|uniref:Uncharacterized protein n=1 Tax=Streptomyces djakartensis TaxID=68193 RepID=A0ABQ3AI22_9ACTN|nr:hypothetical protein GCM10010384_65470 [Streptomyces djakartensis]
MVNRAEGIGTSQELSVLCGSSACGRSDTRAPVPDPSLTRTREPGYDGTLVAAVFYREQVSELVVRQSARAGAPPLGATKGARRDVAPFRIPCDRR